jgi:hypothetical protein
MMTSVASARPVMAMSTDEAPAAGRALASVRAGKARRGSDGVTRGGAEKGHGVAGWVVAMELCLTGNGSSGHVHARGSQAKPRERRRGRVEKWRCSGIHHQGRGGREACVQGVGAVARAWWPRIGARAGLGGISSTTWQAARRVGWSSYLGLLRAKFG